MNLFNFFKKKKKEPIFKKINVGKLKATFHYIENDEKRTADSIFIGRVSIVNTKDNFYYHASYLFNSFLNNMKDKDWVLINSSYIPYKSIQKIETEIFDHFEMIEE